jgi:hypothetical protein
VIKEVYKNIYSAKHSFKFNRDELYKAIVKEHKNYLLTSKPEDSLNFLLGDAYSNLIEDIYKALINSSQNIFGKLLMQDNNKKVGWAYVSNKNDFRTNIHHHLWTSTINGVYYLNVPTNDSGQIQFYDNAENVIYTHQPVTDEMIIFPNYLLHQPLKSNSDEYRIAINIEIKCNDVWKNNDSF